MSAASDLRASAEKNLREGDEWRMETDTRSIPGAMLIGIATPKASCVIQMSAAEWDGLKTAEILGFQRLKPQTALERAQQFKRMQ